MDELSESESPFSLCELDDDYVPSSTDCDSEYCPTPVNKQKPRKVRKSGITTNSRRIFKAYTMTVSLKCLQYIEEILDRLQKHSLAIVYRNQWLNWFP